MTHQAHWILFAVVGWSLAVIGGVGGLVVRLPTRLGIWLRDGGHKT